MYLKRSGSNKLIKIGILAIIVIALGLILASILFVKLATWFNKNEVITKTPIIVKFQRMIEIKERESVSPVVIKNIVYASDEKIDTPLKQLICDTFGAYECKTALAVAQAESGMREDAWNHNSNNTLDIGLFQINSIHWKKEGCSLKELVTVEGNVACAYKLFQESGWGIWAVVQNGSVAQQL